MKIGIIGTGIVGRTLAEGFLNLEHDVLLGTRNIQKDEVKKFLAANSRALAGSFADAAKFGDMIVIAVAGKIAEEAIKMTDKNDFKGKTVIDTTNPISQEPAHNGVLKFFTAQNDSLGEQIQSWLPEAHVVKCFNIVGNKFMTNGKQFGDILPTMFICGNNDEAKKQVTEILTAFNWETLDCGMIQASRVIEPLSILWCIPGFLHNQWSHAFKLLRK
ncbi:MAG TPA: NAD(P)-binding domain-containing protein [Chitinophagaceae bacterium]|nr:NAD(P)-binding domain-containing protein [Chitinophagaceae bacterium]